MGGRNVKLIPSLCRTRLAEIRQGHELVNALIAQLTILMSEQNRTSEAFVQHQARAHPRKGELQTGD
jgi:hypothetical protein